MILKIPNVLSAEQVKEARSLLALGAWVDGKVTAGHQSAKAKNNQQLQENHPSAKKIGEMILSSLEKNPLFLTAALPLKIFPPLFNRYEGGQNFGNHVDNAIRQIPGTGFQIRTDLSATLFLAEPNEYDGGELCVEDTFGVHSVKLPAGHMVLYPASSLHHVKPVTRGSRLASFFWIQSLVRDDGVRTMLLDLDLAIQGLNRDMPNHASVISLTGVYHNLLRRYSEV